MAGTEKKSSFPHIELPPETAAALKRWAKLLPLETVTGLKRLLERRHRFGTPDLKRLLRHLSPEERKILDEIEGRRRELIQKVKQLQQLEEQLDHELGGRWWDDGGGFLILPVPRPAPSKSAAPIRPSPAPPAKATLAPSAKKTRREWWTDFLTEEKKATLETEYKDGIEAAGEGIHTLMEQAKLSDGTYRPRYIGTLLRSHGLFPSPRRSKKKPSLPAQRR